MMLRNYVLCNCQPQAGAVGPTADHREKNSIFEVLVNTWSVVGNVELHHHAVSARADGELPDDSRTQQNLRLFSILQGL